MFLRYVLILFFLPSLLFSKSTEGASEFVTELYKNYSDDNFNIFGTKADTIFSPKFMKLIVQEKKISHEGEIGFWESDPICQGSDRGDVKLAKLRIFKRPGKVFAKVTYLNLGTKMQVKLELIKIKNKWYIQDIITEEEPKSIYKALSKYLEETSRNKHIIK